MDKKIYIYCKKKKFIYTRYFDDISISGKDVLLEKNIKDIEKIIQQHGFMLNNDKKFSFFEAEDKIITGIIITNGKLSVTKEYKDSIKIAYKNYILEDNLKNRNLFSGKFGFYFHVNKKDALDFLQELKNNINC